MCVDAFFSGLANALRESTNKKRTLVELKDSSEGVSPQHASAESWGGRLGGLMRDVRGIRGGVTPRRVGGLVRDAARHTGMRALLFGSGPLRPWQGALRHSGISGAK